MARRFAIPKQLKKRSIACAATHGFDSAQAFAEYVVSRRMLSYGVPPTITTFKPRLDWIVEQTEHRNRDALLEHVIERGLRAYEGPVVDANVLDSRLRGHGYPSPQTVSAWNGDKHLRADVLRQLAVHEANATLDTLLIGGQAIDLYGERAVDTDVLRLGQAIGWPPDLLALALSLFEECMMDGLGIPEHVEEVRSFLVVPRVGRELGGVVASVVVWSLTDSQWRIPCNDAAVSELLDRVALNAIEAVREDEVLIGEVGKQLIRWESTAHACRLGDKVERSAILDNLHALQLANVALQLIDDPCGAGKLSLPTNCVGLPLSPFWRSDQDARACAMKKLILGLLSAA